MDTKRILRSLFVATMLLFALAKSTLAQAQQDEVDAFILEDVLVTASRRAEDLQKASRAIVAVDSETLVRSGIKDAMELPALVPGLTISRNAAELQVSIRGVGDRTISPGTDPGIAFNMDGVYMPKSYQPMAAFFDLDRVEVLKGPQGTLYGRNATAGAVNLITAKPKFNTSGFASLEAGNYSLWRFTGAANYAFNDTIAARLSVQVTDRDGYLTDGYNDDESKAFRLQMLYEPSENTSLLLSGNYFHLGGMGEAAVIAERFDSTPSVSTIPDPSDHWAGPSDPATLARLEATNPASALFPKTDGYQDIDTYVVSATFEHRMDWGSITVIPSLVSSELDNYNYGGLVVTEHQTVESDQYALEARIASTDDAGIKWVLGGYLSKEDVSHESQSKIPIAPGFSFNSVALVPDRSADTWAIFGEAASSLTDSLRLITGLRYTQEEKTLRGYSFNYGFLPGENGDDFPLVKGVNFPGPDYLGAAILHGDKDDDALNFRVGLEYDISDDSMLYATVATGFKAGGFFHSPVETDNSFESEKLTAYTVGTKNRFLKDRLQINGEVFYWDYTDKQETFLGFVPAANQLLLQTRNAGEVTLYGAEVSLVALITANDIVSFITEYVNSEYDEYSYFTPGIGAPPYGSCTKTTATVDGFEGEITDCSGNSLVRAPEWTGRLGYAHTQPMGEYGTLIFNADMTFSSDYYFASDFSELEHNPSYQTYDLSLTWESASTKWSLTAWGKNLTEENIYNGGVQSPTILDAAVGQIGPPRTFGVRLRYNF